MSPLVEGAFSLCMMFLMTNGQFSGNNGNSNAAKNIGNEISLWLNAVLLVVLVVLFVCSVQFSPKCRRRRKKLPHEIRLEKTNEQISQQLKRLSIKPSPSFIDNIYKTMQIQDDQYVNIEDEEEEHLDVDVDVDVNFHGSTEDEDDDESVDIEDELNNGNMMEHGKLLINNLNHYISTQYDEYRGTHHHLIQDMLGMQTYNHPQQPYRHSSTQNDSDYEPL